MTMFKNVGRIGGTEMFQIIAGYINKQATEMYLFIHLFNLDAA